MTKLNKCECGSKEIEPYSTFDGGTVMICQYCDKRTKRCETEQEAIEEWNKIEVVK